MNTEDDEDGDGSYIIETASPSGLQVWWTEALHKEDMSSVSMLVIKAWYQDGSNKLIFLPRNGAEILAEVIAEGP